MKSSPGRPVGTFKGKYPTSVSGKKTTMYIRWLGMIFRCSNPKSHIWKHYGGRGIKVCDRWVGKGGFDNFVDDVGFPLADMSLDRINNDGNYEPGNVRWATAQQQADNRRHAGPPLNPNSLRQRAIAAGLNYRVVINRVYYLGWTEERALSTPKMPVGRSAGWRKQ